MQGTNRAHFNYVLAPGAHLADAIAVVNRGPKPITLKLYASDAVTTPSGGIDLLPANQKPTDVGSWISMANSTLTLQPQQSQVVPFTVTVPANATPGDHSGGVVTSLLTEGSNGVQLDRRLGSRVYLRVTGALAPTLTVSQVHTVYHGTLNPGGTGSATITYTVTNTGNVRLVAAQTVIVHGPFGILSGTARLPDLPEILPGNSLTRTVTMTGVWPTIHLDVTVHLQPAASAGDPPVSAGVVTGSGTVWAWPWGQLIVLLALVAVVLGILWLRRHVKRRVAAAIAAGVDAALRDGQTTDPETSDPSEQPAQ